MKKLKQALWFLKRKVSVFPCCSLKQPCGKKHLKDGKEEPCGKHPLIKWKPYQDLLPTEDEVRSWWTKSPEANLALVTGPISDLLVVDVDGKMGHESFMKLKDDKTDRFKAVVRTGRGYQVYFSYPGVVDVSNSAGKIGLGIDIRGLVELPRNS